MEMIYFVTMGLGTERSKQGETFFFHRGYEKPVFRHWRKSVLCDYFSFQFPWWKKLYSYLGHHVFLSRIPFQPSGKALGLKSYPRKKKTASAVRNYYCAVVVVVVVSLVHPFRKFIFQFFSSISLGKWDKIRWWSFCPSQTHKFTVQSVCFFGRKTLVPNSTWPNRVKKINGTAKKQERDTRSSRQVKQ